MNAPDKVIPIQPAGDDGTVSLYEVRRRIHPRAVTGWFAAWRWGLVALTQVVFYGLPWLEWSGRQAVLFDLGARKFYIGGLVFWPQDVIYLTVLLLVAAYSLFLFTAIAGRLWCGYACPQTVYTEMFMWVERRIEGDRVARIRLDAAPMGAAKVAKKAAKHGIWIALALWTGITFVGYFTPIRELVPAIPFGLGGWEAFWIVFYGFDTPDQFFHVLYHEIGHYVFFQVIGSKVKKRWVTGIYPNSFCATAYGTRNASEDFAESYACYVRDPEYLRHFPEKHAFMRDCVFSGRPETLKEKSVAAERR